MDQSNRGNIKAKCTAVILEVAVFATGFTALIYEVTWHRYLANLAGSDARAAALILAVFLGSMALGYLFFGKLSIGKSHSWSMRVVGILDFGIGCWVLLFHPLYEIAWKHAGLLSFSNWFDDLLTVLYAIVLIGPPTFLMGGNLPLITKAIGSTPDEAASRHAGIYATNTLGAFLGCLVAGYWLIPRFGLQSSLHFGAIFNFAAGAVFFLIAKSSFPKRTVQIPEVDTIQYVMQTNWIRMSAASLLIGFASLSLQMILIRLASLTVGASEYAFSIIVGCYVCFIGLGAYYFARKQRRPFAISLHLAISGVAVLAIYFTVTYWPYLFYLLRTLFTSEIHSFYFYHFAAFLLFSLILGIPLSLLGSCLPRLFKTTVNSGFEFGHAVGRIYFSNTFGCVIGAVVGGYLLLYIMNLDDVMKLSIFSLFTASVLLIPVASPFVHRIGGNMLLIGAAIILFFVPAWNRRYLDLGLFRMPILVPDAFRGREATYDQIHEDLRIVISKDDPNSTVTLAETSKRASNPFQPERDLTILVNGKSDGSTLTLDLFTTRFLAHLPALLSPLQNQKVAVVGFGTGISVGSLSLYPSISEIHCLEIAPSVKTFAPYFDFANHHVSKSPKLRWHIGDAYRFLGGTSTRFSIIVSEPSNPWVSGVDRLYTPEFYRLVASRLDGQGLYSQWFHGYSMSDETVALIISTFSNVFPETRIFQIGRTDFVLLGAIRPITDDIILAMRERLRKTEIANELKGVGIEDLEQLLAHEVWLAPRLMRGGLPHSLLRPRLSFLAGRDFFLGRHWAVDVYLDQERNRIWSAEAARASLLNRLFMIEHNMDKNRLASVAKALCEPLPLMNFPEWRNRAPRACRLALTGAAFAGAAGLQDALSPWERRILPGMTTKAKSNASRGLTNLDDMILAVQTFANSDSIFLPLDPDKLISQTNGCFSGAAPRQLQCLSQMIETFALTGHSGHARRVLSRLIESAQGSIPEHVTLRLNRLVRESEFAANQMGNSNRPSD